MRLFELSETLYIYFSLLLQSGTVVAGVPYSITFASRYKNNYVTEAQIANKFAFLEFYVAGLRLFVRWVLRYAAHK